MLLCLVLFSLQIKNICYIGDTIQPLGNRRETRTASGLAGIANIPVCVLEQRKVDAGNCKGSARL
jgi:hypothetical protein